MLINEIRLETYSARKEKDSFKILTLTTLIGEIERNSKNIGNPSDEEVISTINKFVKGINDVQAILTSQDVKNEITINNLNLEKNIIEKFLPKLLTEAELHDIIVTYKNSGEDNLGKIMGKLKKEYVGLYDGKVASDLTNQILRV